MAKAYLGSERVKLYIGGSAVKKAYLGDEKIYSSGNTVIYRVDSSTAYSEEVDEGDSILSPTTFTPTKSGYTFAGWVSSTSSTTALTSYTMGESSVTVYALFYKTVTLKLYDGSTTATTETATIYYCCGVTTYPSYTLTQTSVSGWTASGWATSSSATASASVSNGATVTLTASVTYYGLYYKTITLSYNGNSSTSGSTSSQTGTRYWNSAGNYSSPSFTLRSNGFARTYYKFSKWAKGSTSGTQYSAGASVTLTASTTFYAIWTSIATSGSVSGSVTVKARNWIPGYALVSFGKYFWTSSPTVSVSISSGDGTASVYSKNRSYAIIKLATSDSSSATATITWTATGYYYTSNCPYSKETGTEEFDINNWTADTISVSFSNSYDSAPSVLACWTSITSYGSDSALYADLTITVSSITTSGFTLKVSSSGNAYLNGVVSWCAVGE